MDNLNIIEILKLGLPGLVFLLSLLSFRLLTKEQDKKCPSQPILKSVKQFMHVNIFLAVLTVSASIIGDHENGCIVDSTVFNIQAKTGSSSLPVGNAEVCINAGYANRHLLLKDAETGKVIQVYAKTVVPCSDGYHISLNQTDALNLGWRKDITASLVEVVTAMPGQKFIM